MGFATSLETNQMMGVEDGDEKASEADDLTTPGGIIVETLLNMRTVAALSLEPHRLIAYEEAVNKHEPSCRSAVTSALLTGGISQFVQQWVNALQLWFGGWVLVNNQDTYEVRDFLVANFAVLFSLFGLVSAFQDMADSEEVKKSAGRIFYLLDRKSTINPLSDEGKKLLRES